MNEARLKWITEKGTGLDQHGEGYEEARSNDLYRDLLAEAETKLRASAGEDEELFHRLRKIDNGRWWIRGDPQLLQKADDAYRLLTALIDSDLPPEERNLSHHFDLDAHLYIIAALAFDANKTRDGHHLMPEAIDIMAEPYVSLPIHTDVTSKDGIGGIQSSDLKTALDRTKERKTAPIRGSWT